MQKDLQKNAQKNARTAIYAGAFLALASAAYLASAAMRAPQPSSDGATHKLAARQESRALQDSKVSNQPFRYGPDVNHGRSDTPVYNSQQALKEAREEAPPAQNTPRNWYRSRNAGRTGSEMYGH